MAPVVQWSLVALILAASLAYLARRAWRTWTAPACAGGCACAGPATPPHGGGTVTIIPDDQVTLRGRVPRP